MSIKFDSATSKAVVIDHNSSLDIDPSTTEFTISIWFKAPVTGADGSLLAKRGSSSLGYQFAILSNKLYARTGSVGNTSAVTLVNTNVWTHGVMINRLVSGSERTYLYIDGVLNSNSGTGAPISGAGTNTLDLIINARRGSSNSDFGYIGSSTISDVRLYKGRAFTDDEVLSLYSTYGDDSDFESMTGRWLLNEGFPGEIVSGADSVLDYWNGYHGTPNSAPTYEESLIALGSMI